MMNKSLAVTVMLMLVAQNLGAQETITRSKGLSADISHDGRVAIDLAGDIWIVPANGGEATRVTKNLKSAQRPRWSPEGLRIAYQAMSGETLGMWILDLTDGTSRNISRDSYFDLHPAWHPDGNRVVYASDATGMGFDLWEVDLPTGIHWRLSDREGDEIEPAWSSDGRDLAYLHRQRGQSSLILRRHGLPEEVLVTTTDKLAAPSWRPDGSLITYLRTAPTGSSLDMIILSEPRLARQYSSSEAFIPAPVSWLDRDRMVYTAGGVIRQRLFNAWSSRPLPFRATIVPQPTAIAATIKRRELQRFNEPGGRLTIHASRLYDGLGAGYLTDMDIVIDGGRIEAVEPHRGNADGVVINMGDLTVMPGYVDAAVWLPAKVDDRLGAQLLTTGVTTVVAKIADAERLNRLWSGKEMPGPRVVGADDTLGLRISTIADSMTPGMGKLLLSRQAKLMGVVGPVARRFAEPPTIDAGVTAIVLGSRENGLPAGLGLHAELRALTAAGLEPAQSLRAAGVNAAAALGFDPYLGRVSVGAVADLVLVDGDPLGNIEDALKVVAVVRNGRFFSVSGLIDRAQPANSVE